VSTGRGKKKRHARKRPTIRGSFLESSLVAGGDGPFHPKETVDRSCGDHNGLAAISAIDWLKEA